MWPFTRRPSPEALGEVLAALTYKREGGRHTYFPDDSGPNSHHPVVWACINAVSQSLARGEWKGNPTLIRQLNRMRPSKYTAIRSLAEDLLGKGNAYLYRDTGTIVVLRADNVTPMLTGTTLGHRHTTIGLLDPSKLCTIHGPMFDGIKSPSIMEGAARVAVKLNRSAYKHQAANLDSGLQGRNVLTLAPELLSWGDDRLQALARSINTNSEVARREGYIPVFPAGVEPKELGGDSPADMEMVELVRFTVEDICRAFGVPPRMVGHYSAQLRVRGIEGQAEDFVKWTLMPHAENIGNSLTAAYLPLESRAAPVTLDVVKLGLGSMSERITAARAGVGPNAPLFTPEQALDLVDIEVDGPPPTPTPASPAPVPQDDDDE